MKKLKRDIVVSSTDKGDLVGVYFENEPDNVLEMSPEKADRVIKAYNSKITCKYCGEEFEETTNLGGEKVSAQEHMEDSEEHLCSACGERQDYESCKKLDGVCIECFEPED